MREQLTTMSGKSFSKSHKDFKYIEVKYFDATELVNFGGPELAEMMNEKIEAVKERYEHALVALEQYNRRQQDQIALFRKLERVGNVGISFDEMNCEEVIEKLWHIEQNSQRIWNAFSKIYKSGFFYGQIETEFGISPQSHDTLVSRFDGKVNEFKEQCKE